jgi:hypothetical protein
MARFQVQSTNRQFDKARNLVVGPFASCDPGCVEGDRRLANSSLNPVTNQTRENDGDV